MGVVRRWLIMSVLGFSGGVIFLLPYLKEIYNRPLTDAMQLSNTEFGLIVSAFGLTAWFCYFPGGWVADRVSARKLISSSLVSTGLLGFYFATFPGFLVSVIIHALWGVTITLLFWASMVRVTRGWAPPEQQGRAFGILEAIRGVAELSVTTLLGAIFVWMGSSSNALQGVITQTSIIVVVLGVVSWFVIEDTVPIGSEEGGHQAGLAEVKLVLKMPVVWLIAMVMLATNTAYNASYYIGQVRDGCISRDDCVRDNNCDRSYLLQTGCSIRSRFCRRQDRYGPYDNYLSRDSVSQLAFVCSPSRTGKLSLRNAV